jgi:N-acetylneuraminate synthase/N,N'-diacetyllegionaminate synthase
MIELAGIPIGANARPYIIAEVGINAWDDLRLAKTFIEIAADCGADAVKFQTHLPDAEMNESELGAVEAGDVYDTVVESEWSRADHEALKEHANDNDVTFLSTPFSVEAVDMLEEIGVDAIKIGSGEMDNYHLLDRAIETGKPLLISTGMHTIEEVQHTCSFVEDRTDQFALLYCVSNYPTTPSDFDFSTIDRLYDLADGPVGFSDHSSGVEAAKVAIGNGADIVEKHFTLDRRLPGPDQVVSVESDELSDLCSFAHLYHETSTERSGLTAEEEETKRWAQHSVVTTAPIKEGERFERENVTTKRPGTGIPAKRYFDIISKTAARDLPPSETLDADDIQKFE